MPSNSTRLGLPFKRIAAQVYWTLLIFWLGAEFFLSFRMKFVKVEWPAFFDSQKSWYFQPGSTVAWTNHIDYWTKSPVNSLGFLDREPLSESEAKDHCRVLILGDSFVEAAQVSIDKKFHVLLEEGLRRDHPTWPLVRTMALGQSGTGQANQILFYEKYGRAFHPNVVILEFTANDFANNHPALEAVRYGWNPQHAPRPFVVPAGKGYALQAFDPEYEKWKIAKPDSGDPAWMYSLLYGKSRLFTFGFSVLERRNPALAAGISGGTDHIRLFHQAKSVLESDFGYAGAFDGWKYPKDLDEDDIFNAADLPRVFKQALELTDATLQYYQTLARRDHFRLLVFASHSMRFSKNLEMRNVAQRRLLPERQMDYLRPILKRRGIDLVDQGAWMMEHGHPYHQANFRNDGHWNPQGHQWAAEALTEYFEKVPPCI